MVEDQGELFPLMVDPGVLQTYAMSMQVASCKTLPITALQSLQYRSVACARAGLALQWESETGSTRTPRQYSTLDALMGTTMKGSSLSCLFRACHGSHDQNNNSLVFTELVPLVGDLLFVTVL